MKNLFAYGLFSLLIICLGAGCNSNAETNPNSPKIYTCRDYNFVIPIETVDAQTNGKKSGSTHFCSSLADIEVFYSYENLQSNEEAAQYFVNQKKGFTAIIRKRELKNQTNDKVGEKILSYSEGNRYVLKWVSNTRFNLISSDSLTAIEEIEKDCNL